MSLSFTVPGVPVGKARARVTINGTFTPAKTANYESMVALFAQQAMAGAPLLNCPVRLTLAISCQIPASWSQRKRALALAGAVMPMTKPDGSNVLKAIEDALNGVVWVDDAQVVNWTMQKRYAETPGVVVSVSRAEGGVS